MQKQIIHMLEMQDSMNTKVSNSWRENGNAWYRAIWIECAELLDHYGWKWWKAQSPDMDQVELELIDIWHFGLSILLESGVSKLELAERIEKQLAESAGEDTLPEGIESFALTTLSTKSFDVSGFANLMKLANLSFESLYTRYVGKNVLNFFRQDHGYKEGTYIKIWAGREDNEHLIEAIAALDSTSTDFQKLLYEALEARYVRAS
jgi:dimeric dUTPase (all-alpha-NTP-PPase superfamily)